MDNPELEARKYLPLKRGNILVTTKEEKIIGDLVPVNRAIHIAEMAPEDAFTMLETLSMVSLYDDTIREQAKELLDRVDYMALAIEQAAAYIRQNRMRISEYIRLFDQSESERDRILRLAAGYAWDKNERPTKAVMTTWTIIFQRLSEKHPASLDLLRRMSLLDPTGMTFEILDLSLSEIPVHKDFVENMNPLLTLSIVSKPSSQHEVYQMHNLVSFCTRLQMENANVFIPTLYTVIHHLSIRMPKDEEHQEVSTFLPHSLQVSSHASSKNISTESLAVLEHLLANYLIHHGNHNAGLVHGTLAYDARQATQSTDLADFPDIMETLAHAQFNMEKFSETQKWLSLVLAEKRKRYGEEDMRTLATVGHLATCHSFRGETDEAVRLHRQHLEAVQRIEGPQSDAVIPILTNLGNVYFHPLLDYAAAYKLHDEALKLALQSKTYGSLRINQLKIVTARDMSKLGLWPGARALLKEVMDEYEQADVSNLGKIAYVNEDIAEAYMDEELYSESEEYFLKALDQYRRSDTPNPKILSNIGELYKRMGDKASRENSCGSSEEFYTSSKYFFTLSLRRKENLYGKEHSSTLLTMRNIADLYVSMKIPQQALHWYKKALAAGERSLEATNRIRFRHRHLIAETLKVLGRLEEAAEACKEALDGRAKLLGRMHTDYKESADLLLEINGERAALEEEWKNEDGWDSLVSIF